MRFSQIPIPVNSFMAHFNNILLARGHFEDQRDGGVKSELGLSEMWGGGGC
jgi:hypothetical protein